MFPSTQLTINILALTQHLVDHGLSNASHIGCIVPTESCHKRGLDEAFPCSCSVPRYGASCAEITVRFHHSLVHLSSEMRSKTS